MSHPIVHKQICAHYDAVLKWYESKISEFAYPIYSSYDVRDGGYKIGIVDANIFPAGFNNICPADLDDCPQLFKSYLETHYELPEKKILLVTEEHTQNPFYWDNVYTIKSLLEQAGCTLLVALPRKFDSPMELESASGKKILVHSAFPDNPVIQSFQPDLIVSNNDFSDSKEEWAQKITLPMNPPRELGWYQRKKSQFFRFYNQLVQEFCEITEVDPFLMTVMTEEFSGFDITDDHSVNAVAERVDQMIAELKTQFAQRQINQTPFIFVKNNSGTYGLGVVKVNSGAEFASLNYKSRKKMKAAKGGRDVVEVVIQEGIPSVITAEGATAEPVIYMIGHELAGGFFRTHTEKTDTESLNSPGAVYKRLCISDLGARLAECPCENVYGWASKLALLAIAKEGQQLKVPFSKFKRGPT